jgi:transposase
VRPTTIARKLLGVAQLFAVGIRSELDALVIEVRPPWRKPRCGTCGQRAPGYDVRPRRWTALPIGSTRVVLEYAQRRVLCRRCGGIRVEKVPWAAHASWFTEPLEELAAYLATVTDKTTVTQLLGISWRSVGHIMQRVVERKLSPTLLSSLRRIGIDEFSYRKRHHYLTVVVDHDTGRVVWAAPGRGAATLRAFFAQLGPEGVARLQKVTMDMAGGYLKAVREQAPHVHIIFDRFHAQRLASDALDSVRRALWQQLKGTEAGRAVKHTRFVLLKASGHLSATERQRLSTIQQTNRPLYRAYLLKEALVDVFERKQRHRARAELLDWIAWACRSRLPPFVRVARTLRQHFDGIVAYFDERLTNGVVEGINTRLRMMARRAFGFHSAYALIAMIRLCCSGITLSPPLPRPTQPS